MACNQWVPPGLTAKATAIPLNERIEFMVHNASKPIPEHKFDTVYFYLFNERFKPSSFGHFSNITELIASKPNLYRTISSDGRAFIHSFLKSQQQQHALNGAPVKYTVPQWAITTSNKSKIYSPISMHFKIYKHGKLLRDIDLMQLLFAEQNKSFLLFGRDEDTDFCLQHISISRKHCFFQFANDGVLYIYDVSTHGVLLNEKQLPKKKFVELKHKDSLKFGHSTRCYVYLVSKRSTLSHGDAINNNKENEVNECGDREKEALRLQNKQQEEKMHEMQKMIEKLKVDLSTVQKSVSTKSKQIVSLMEQMECLSVTHSTRNKQQRQQQELHSIHSKRSNSNSEPAQVEHARSNRNGNRQRYERKSRRTEEEQNDDDEEEQEEVVDADEKDEEEESEQSEHEEIPKRISKIKGIDFVKEYENLSKLTVTKLRYYVDKNGIDVGRVKKAELVKLIKRDLRDHFDV